MPPRIGHFVRFLDCGIPPPEERFIVSGGSPTERDWSLDDVLTRVNPLHAIRVDQ